MKVPHADLHRVLVHLVKEQGGEVRIPMKQLLDHDSLKNDLDFTTDSESQEVVLKVGE